jgi:hypothetical protein
MINFYIKRELNVSSDKLWNLLCDFGYSLSSNITIKLETKGKPESNGIGSIRIVTIGKRQFLERLENIKPKCKISYSLLSGAPVKNYIGNIDIEPIRTNTLITWKVQFRPKVLGSGWIVKWFVKRTINYIISEIETECNN